MKRFLVLSIVLAIVSLHQLDAKYVSSTPGNNEEEEPWTWSISSSTDTFNKSPETVTQEPIGLQNVTEEPNPCMLEYNPEIPDFSAPGLRLSEVKCFEYIYDIRVREQQERLDQACVEYLKKEGTYFEIEAIGGRNTLPGEFPHMVAIGWPTVEGGWIFQCGGTLISDRFVLTAAHCSKASGRDTSLADVEPKIVRLGDKNILDNPNNDGISPTTVNIKRIIPYPKYKPPQKYYDVALVELESPVKFTKFIQPACLGTGNSDSLVGQKATLTGWGVVETASRKTSPELQAALVEIFNSSLCDRLLTPYSNRLWSKMQKHQLCAGKLAGGVDACQGDSGGPLQVKIPLPANTSGRMYHVVGITSFGIGCALPNLPGIYTRVASFADWIEDNVWK